MNAVIPLIRAGGLAPLVKWLERRGRAVDRVLSDAGLSCDPLTEPDRLIPMHAVASVFRDSAVRENCPDLCWRIIKEMSVEELGRYGLLVLSARTAADGLRAASVLMPQFCSHERLDIMEEPDFWVISSGFLVPLDPESLHQAQIHTLALIRSLLTVTGRSERHFEAINLPPHPLHGFSHLPPDIARVATVACNDVMVLKIKLSLLQRPLKASLMRPADHMQSEAWDKLPGADVGFVEVVRNLLADALTGGTPSAELMAQNAGVTLRTLQRRLAAEGTTFRALVEDTRRALALKRISEGTEAFTDISAGLGYSTPGSLSRAVRKWTDHSPRGLRNEAAE